MPVSHDGGCQILRFSHSAGRAAFTADLGGLVAEPECVVKVPATLFCEEATKANVDPPPPGGGGPGPAGRLLCYKARCPRRDAVPLAFGRRRIATDARQ